MPYRRSEEGSGWTAPAPGASSLTALASVGTHFAEDTQSLLVVQCLHMKQQMSGQHDEWAYCCCLSFYKQLLVAFNRIF